MGPYATITLLHKNAGILRLRASETSGYLTLLRKKSRILRLRASGALGYYYATK